MVYRMGVPCCDVMQGLAGWRWSAFLGKETRERDAFQRTEMNIELIYVLRRSRGAIGRYQGPRGAVTAAAGLLRRHMRMPHGRCRRRRSGNRVGKGVFKVRT